MLVTYSVTTFAKSFLVMSRTKTRFVFWFLRQAVPCPGPPLPRSRHPWADSGVLGSLLLSRPTSRPRPAWGPPWSAAESVPSHPDCVLRPPPRSHTARAHPSVQWERARGAAPAPHAHQARRAAALPAPLFPRPSPQTVCFLPTFTAGPHSRCSSVANLPSQSVRRVPRVCVGGTGGGVEFITVKP